MPSGKLSQVLIFLQIMLYINYLDTIMCYLLMFLVSTFIKNFFTKNLTEQENAQHLFILPQGDSRMTMRSYTLLFQATQYTCTLITSQVSRQKNKLPSRNLKSFLKKSESKWRKIRTEGNLITYILNFTVQGRGQQTFSRKGHAVNIFSFAGSMAPSAATQLCHFCVKAVRGTT